jgi:hypothetical protein
MKPSLRRGIDRDIYAEWRSQLYPLSMLAYPVRVGSKLNAQKTKEQ